MHEDGFVCALRFANGKIASGGKGGNICVWEPDTLEIEAQVSFGSLIRAVDMTSEAVIVGLRDGSIKYFALDDVEGSMDTLMESHADGEVWGLDVFEDGKIMTSGDDNAHMIIDPEERALIDEALISEDMFSIMNGPTTLSPWPSSQQSRAIAVNGEDGMMAIGTNGGRVIFKKGDIDDPP